MRVKRRLIGIVVLALATGTMTALSAGSAAADIPVFPVMNTSEQLPDGVWFRYGPDPSETHRITGVGVYKGEYVRVKCYTVGTPFGPYNNDIWYYAYDVERPMVGSISNEGWINTHYVNDGMTADHANPAVPSCSAGGGTPSPTPPTPAPIAVYYSPYSINGPSQYKLADQSVRTVYASDWETNCGSSVLAYRQAEGKLASGQSIKTLAGWSAGRMGPIYFLNQATDAQRKQINYVLLIDPGYYSQMTCDRQWSAGSVLVHWLQVNPNAHLVAISSSQISQQANSKGIQETYFNAIRNASHVPMINLRPRVLTCNYTFSHDDAFFSAQYWIAHEIGTTSQSCPTLRDSAGTFHPTWGWNP
jgi:hypothetical protein